MSTNKTPNYALHSWLPTDDFQLFEINQNFAAIDSAIHDLFITGSYIGAGTNTTQRVELGFQPRILLIMRSSAKEGSTLVRSYALAIPGQTDPSIEFDDTGITLSANDGQCLTAYPAVYHYMAIL